MITANIHNVTSAKVVQEMLQGEHTGHRFFTTKLILTTEKGETVEIAAFSDQKLNVEMESK